MAITSGSDDRLGQGSPAGRLSWLWKTRPGTGVPVDKKPEMSVAGG
jgi:hypothetical protein